MSIITEACRALPLRESLVIKQLKEKSGKKPVSLSVKSSSQATIVRFLLMDRLAQERPTPCKENCPSKTLLLELESHEIDLIIEINYPKRIHLITDNVERDLL